MWGSFGERVTPAADERDAAWVQSRFDWELVNCSGFERYIRIEHTAPGEPEEWSAPVGLVAEIAQAAAEHTSTASEAWFAVWEGYGWVSAHGYWVNTNCDSSPLRRVLTSLRARRSNRDDHRRQIQEHRDLERELSSVPRLELDIRSYYLLAGPVDAAAGISSPGRDSWPQMPDLWWPKDLAWFVATDTDLDWTVVGGSERLAADLLRRFPEQAQPVRIP